MAESIPDLRELPKNRAYGDLFELAKATTAGIPDEISVMSTLASLIHNSMGFLWTGFYRVAEPNSLLRVGPYQGSLGCLEIRFGQGVCGLAAERRETVIVADVDAFPGHISCDSRSRSEIVVPVLDRNRNLIAVLDIDSAEPDCFDDDDRRGLEKIVCLFAETG